MYQYIQLTPMSTINPTKLLTETSSSNEVPFLSSTTITTLVLHVHPLMIANHSDKTSFLVPMLSLP
jgi:hypothetical protein